MTDLSAVQDEDLVAELARRKALTESIKATEIPMHDCGLRINTGRDGTWLHFTASNGEHAGINIENMAVGRGIIDAALRQWAADRQEQAEVERLRDLIQNIHQHYNPGAEPFDTEAALAALPDE